jgi:zinc protease
MLSVEPISDGPVLLLDPTGPQPVVAVYLWVQVGSADEEEGLYGAAHLLEHMLFKGAGSLGVGDITAQIEAIGGDLNAFTSVEETVFHATVPAGHELLALRLLSEMVLRPALDPDELAREKLVVIEEIRGSTDDPTQVLGDVLRRRVYGDHPYARPVLGSEESVAAITPERLRAFHSRWYIPQNTVVAVVGPVDPKAIRDWAGAHLRGGPARAVRPHRLPQGPQAGIFCLDPGFDDRTIELAFPVPGHAHADIVALDLLVSALGDGASARVTSRLRQELDLVQACWCELESEADGGAIIFGFTAREGTAQAALRELARIIEQVEAGDLSEGELRRARASLRLDRMRDRETVDGRAHKAAWYQVFFGDPAMERAYDEAVARVTLEDLRRVARQYLRWESAIVGGIGPVAEVHEAGLRAALDEGRATAVHVAPRSAGLHSSSLSCGARLVVDTDEGELVAISVVGLGGGSLETRRTAALSNAWAQAFTTGAGGLGAIDFAALLEQRGGSLRAWTGKSTCGVQLVIPREELDLGLALLSEALLMPRFDEEDVKRVVADMREEQRTGRDDTNTLAHDLLSAALYQGHPWGFSPSGTAASLAQISPRSLRAYHGRVMVGANLAVGVAGPVDPAEISLRLNRLWRRLPAGAPIEVVPPTFAEAFRRRRAGSVPREEAVAQLLMGFPAVGVNHSDDPVVTVIAAILGGAVGGGGRLFAHLREELGLAYEVGAWSDRSLGAGALMVSVATDPERVAVARRALWRELRALSSEGVPEEELGRVRDGLVNGVVLGLQRASARAEHLASYERYGGGADRFRERLLAPGRVTRDDVGRVAAAVIRDDRVVTVHAGPKSRPPVP